MKYLIFVLAMSAMSVVNFNLGEKKEIPIEVIEFSDPILITPSKK